MSENNYIEAVIQSVHDYDSWGTNDVDVEVNLRMKDVDMDFLNLLNTNRKYKIRIYFGDK